MDYSLELKKIIKENALMMSVLKDAKLANIPNWYIAGGAIRNLVFDLLHNYPQNSHLKDIDVVYFDSNNLSRKFEKEYENKLKILNPKINWEVTNQANTHIFHPGFPILSCCEDTFKFFSERANCVGVKLDPDDEIIVFAPYGLGDLFNLIIQPVPPTPAYEMILKLYKNRIKDKKWKETWPKLKVVEI
jgi:uncharacterized protein